MNRVSSKNSGDVSSRLQRRANIIRVVKASQVERTYPGQLSQGTRTTIYSNTRMVVNTDNANVLMERWGEGKRQARPTAITSTLFSPIIATTHSQSYHSDRQRQASTTRLTVCQRTRVMFVLLQSETARTHTHTLHHTRMPLFPGATASITITPSQSIPFSTPCYCIPTCFAALGPGETRG